MLFIVIERFKPAAIVAIAERFRLRGRQLPEGLTYHASWVEPSGARCFQIMETSQAELLNTWASAWDDLMEFEVVPVITSAEFWANVPMK